MKSEMRILGIDDAPFDKFNPGERVLVIGTVFRGGQVMESVVTTTITADGENSTRNLIKMINNSRSKGQLSVILLDGIAVGGLNVVDINEIYKRTGLPVITVTRKLPNMKKLKVAINNVENPERKLDLIERAGEMYSYTPNNKYLHGKSSSIFFQIAGISKEEAQKILKLTIVHGLLPEPIRVAHIIGSALKNGESRGRA